MPDFWWYVRGELVPLNRAQHDCRAVYRGRPLADPVYVKNAAGVALALPDGTEVVAGSAPACELCPHQLQCLACGEVPVGNRYAGP